MKISKILPEDEEEGRGGEGRGRNGIIVSMMG